LLGRHSLLNGETLWIMYKDRKLTENDVRILKNAKESKKEGCIDCGGFLIGAESDDSRKIMEVALI